MTLIVVTGASRGIGCVLATHLSSKGYEIIGLSRNIGDSLPFEQIECDVRDVSHIEKALKIIRQKGKIYALINVAGVLYTRGLFQYKDMEVNDIFDTNAVGTINICRYFSKLMLKNGKGRIINFSSIAASIGLQGDSVYSASKSAIECFSKAIARELWRREITVNCIAPGPIKTDMTRDLNDESFLSLVNDQIIKKEHTPENIIPIIDFLLSEDSSSITGSVFNIGGY